MIVARSQQEPAKNTKYEGFDFLDGQQGERTNTGPFEGFPTEQRHRLVPRSGGDRAVDWQWGASATG